MNLKLGAENCFKCGMVIKFYIPLFFWIFILASCSTQEKTSILKLPNKIITKKNANFDIKFSKKFRQPTRDQYFVSAVGITVGIWKEDDNSLLLKSLIKARLNLIRMIVSDEEIIMENKIVIRNATTSESFTRIDKSSVLVEHIKGLSSSNDDKSCKVFSRLEFDGSNHNFKECRVVVKIPTSIFDSYRKDILLNRYHIHE